METTTKISIQFKVPSDMFGITDAVIDNLDHTISTGVCSCGDGTNYVLNKFELNQLEEIKKGNINEDDFKPASTLKFPNNLIALLGIDGNKLTLPSNIKFSKKDYDAVKAVLLKAGGKYTKNAFEFKEEAEVVYNRILNGEDYNLKKKFQFFGTPDKLADELVQLANIQEDDEILEPSAGQGAIINAISRILPNKKVDCYELMPQNQEVLKKLPNAVLRGDDFLECIYNFYDKIIANPPFTKNQDVLHVLKMYELLEKGGRLVSIMSTSWRNGSQKKQVEFREFLNKVGAQIIEVEAGKFKESGTNVATVIVVIDKKK